MSNPAPPAKNPPTVTPTYSPLPALLSYLVPGLGQIYQGRVAKGVLFMVCIYALFFYGQRLGAGTVPYRDGQYTVTSNVYLPDTAKKNNTWGMWPSEAPDKHAGPGWRLLANLYNRPQFLGQFWVGVAAWPAVWQYASYDEGKESGDSILGNYQRTPPEEVANRLQTDGDKT